MNRASDADIKAHFRLLKEYSNVEGVLLRLTQEMRRLLELRFHLMPLAHEVPEKMDAFAKEFVQRGKGVLDGTQDAIEMTTWTHQQIASIHPFNDAVLLLGGLPCCDLSK